MNEPATQPDSDGTEHRMFIGGTAHGRVLPVSTRHRFRFVAKPPDLSFDHLDKPPKSIDLSECYTRRKMRDPHGRWHVFMVLESITDDELIEILNKDSGLS